MTHGIDDGTEMTLAEWLAAMDAPKKFPHVITYQFPTDQHRKQYLGRIGRRSRAEVVRLLRRLLLPSGTLGQDRFVLGWALQMIRKGKASKLSEYHRRLVAAAATKGKIQPWEGITWVLDLLPHHPRQAIDAVDAYFTAHCVVLPDGRLVGIPDAMAVIRAKFILNGHVNAGRTLDSLSPRQFEILSAALYAAMGYRAKVTPQKADGGRDVEARRSTKGRRELCLVECKHYPGRNVGPDEVRELLGVVSDKKANKGVLATSGGFTKGALALAKRNPRLELLARRDVLGLLNEHLGTDWPTEVDRIISEWSVRPSK